MALTLVAATYDEFVPSVTLLFDRRINIAGLDGSNILVRDGARFTVRPEKIHLEGAGGPVPAGSVAVEGVVRDVVYLGSDTRYHVALDLGGELEVIKQNVTTSSMEVLALKGQRVRLVWDRQHTLPVDMDPAAASGT